MSTPGPFQYRAVSRKLLTDALAHALPMAETDGDGPLEVPTVLIEALADLISAEGEGITCDHSVGICACEARGIYEVLMAWVDGQQPCPRCGGEGFVAVQVEEVEGQPDWLPVNCPLCAGRCYIELDYVERANPDRLCECGKRPGIGWFDTEQPTWAEPWWMCQECVDRYNQDRQRIGFVDAGPLVAKPAPAREGA